MVVKSFDIKINNKLETIKYEDDMPFGDFEHIISKAANMKDESNLLENVQIYRREIMLKSIKEAPFALTKEGIDSVGFKTITEIGNIILEDYPLGEYLTQMMEPFSSLTNTKE
tara:strand:+ start:1317 stop:1655 length:339 start_codon:yes stop_codon:yes gene_type:complete